MAEIKKRIATRLAIVNLIILGLSGIAAYFLAGETLQPIEESVAAQKRFVADASHELKTPLTSIKTENEVALRDSKLSLTKAKALLISNLEEVDKLKKFTDYLLSLSRYESAAQALPKTAVFLPDLVQAVLARHKPALRLKAHTVSTKLSPVTLTASEPALSELLTILLDNSIKYTPPSGRIAVVVAKSGRQVRLTVSDTGAGIDPSDLPHIFDRFYRSESSRSKTSVDGYGLGLAIAKSIVEAHHGTIQVQSRPGSTTFTVLIPV
jgi:signal transduction histidine kinase